jgi:protoporphyrinogen oxidase
MNWANNSPRILILGAGCTGLGAAYRLHELGYGDFLVLEQGAHPGGLAASFVDGRGFTWDLGGHVQFSHYPYFDRLMDAALGDAWLRHGRQSYIWTHGAFVPYPFQNNLRRLPAEELARCIKGLLSARRNGHSAPSNFREWILHSFGDGIADVFLIPYNFKVWAHPAETMHYGWVGERVATVNLERVIDNVILGQDDAGWGPNSTFRFPAQGGTGAIWESVARMIPAQHLQFNSAVSRIDASAREVTTADGCQYHYDRLISTLPLDALAAALGDGSLQRDTGELKFTTTHVVGIGLAGQPPEYLAGKNWMYFPEEDCPFYRVTVFSNYSPQNVPDASRHWSLMAEVSESPFRPVNGAALLADVIRGMLATRLIRSEQEIVSTWQRRLEHGYPVPTIDRDEHLDAAFSRLEAAGIFSRGRFGAWKYEVGNQDHTCMQGVEAVNRILFGALEMTVNHPALVNQAGAAEVTPAPQELAWSAGARP